MNKLHFKINGLFRHLIFGNLLLSFLFYFVHIYD